MIVTEHGVFDFLTNLFLALYGKAAGEWVFFKVSCKANSCADDNIALVAVFNIPLIHYCLPPFLLFCL